MKQLDPKAVWLFFFSSVFRLVYSALLLTVIFNAFLDDVLGTSPSYFSLNGFWVVLLVFCILLWFVSKLTFKFYKYELRDDGFRKEHGIIWKRYVTIPYDRIQNVDIYRGVFARLLGLSDLQIQTAGGVMAASYGGFSEGRLVGVSKEVAEQLRDELIQRAQRSKTQGL